MFKKEEKREEKKGGGEEVLALLFLYEKKRKKKETLCILVCSWRASWQDPLAAEVGGRGGLCRTVPVRAAPAHRCARGGR